MKVWWRDSSRKIILFQQYSNLSGLKSPICTLERSYKGISGTTFDNSGIWPFLFEDLNKM